MFHKTMCAILATFVWFQISIAETNFFHNDNPFSSGVSGSDTGILAPNVQQEFRSSSPLNEEMMHQTSIDPISTASSTSKISPSPVETFVSEFNSAVYTSKILPDIFDLKDLSPEAFSKSVQDYVYARGAEIGHSNPQDVAILVAAPIKEGIDSLTLPIMLDIYGNSIAKYLFAKGTLNSSNASSLGRKYAKTMEDNAERIWKKETPESKFLVLEDGYVDFVKSILHLGLDTFNDLALQYSKEVKRVASKL